jgi:hypothetical protein
MRTIRTCCEGRKRRDERAKVQRKRILKELEQTERRNCPKRKQQNRFMFERQIGKDLYDTGAA